ncbi:hypothetical protein LN96_12860 [Xanthomonas citri pv. citri]|uniref:Uncharacterized protein n=2 Tax=Xanthomonas citri TaxID=346 RepID=A0A9X6BLI1_XANCI|nr:hypothetical protein B7L66_25000 [Xanthomonas citri pv. citri]OMG04715.1 hypothetical protein LN96_12860 [Xanthomonas citri pv. citri]PIB18507.1 hypothetical protein AA099_22890 [Xanthomonas citri pv. citri]PWF11589.1 hypothetical protein TP38_23240 [Xanthomonas citri pv. citri]UVG61312.1 hypothetical protein Xdur_023455 [Xanthomonas citri pv. durantae]
MERPMSYQPVPTVSVMTPQARFTLCFCIAVLLTGPFGLIIGPVLSRLFRRRVERLHPTAAYAAAQRSAGHFNAGQLWAITACGVFGLIGLVALIPSLFFLVLSIAS